MEIPIEFILALITLLSGSSVALNMGVWYRLGKNEAQQATNHEIITSLKNRLDNCPNCTRKEATG